MTATTTRSPSQAGDARRRRAPSRAAGRPRADLAMACLYVAILSLVGGAAPGWGAGEALIGLATLPLLAAVWAGRGWDAYAALPPSARLALAGIVLLPLLQLVPLPPGVWTSLPGQALRGQVLALVGLGGTWQPATLSPLGTAYAAGMALGFATLVVAVSSFEEREVAAVWWVVFGAVLLGVLVGLLQVTTGGSPRLHRVGHHGSLIGLFANKNHMGLMLAASLPVAWALLSRLGGRAPIGRTLLGAYASILVPCLVVTNSRAGLALGLLSLLVVGLQFVRVRSAAVRWAIVAGVLAVIAAVLASPAFDALFERVGAVGDDDRWRFLQESAPLARLYWPTGSGAGSFAAVYAPTERLGWVSSNFLNHVHNEPVELVIEFGVPGVAVLLLVAASVVPAVAVWARLPRDGGERRLPTAALLVLALFALHCLVDYPLRRPACLVLFAAALGVAYREARLRRAG